MEIILILLLSTVQFLFDFIIFINSSCVEGQLIPLFITYDSPWLSSRVLETWMLTHFEIFNILSIDICVKNIQFIHNIYFLYLFNFLSISSFNSEALFTK
jgi:hypothetical protein